MQHIEAVIEKTNNKIPQELLELDQWVLWNKEIKKGVPTKQTYERKDYTKVPYQVNGQRASSTDANTWRSHKDVLATLQATSGAHDGIAFVLNENDEYTGIDIDECINDGVIDPAAEKIINELNSYTEYSQSGTGFHIILKGKKPGKRCKNEKEQIEIYDNSRFLIMTGDHVEGTPVIPQERQEELNTLYDKTFDKKNPGKDNMNVSTSDEMTDQDILSIAFQSKNGEKISQLYMSEWEEHYTSQSQADQALCNYIAFYTQEPTQIDRIFKGSKLYRDKWDREDYKASTIENAIQGLSATYQKDDFQLYVDDAGESIIIPKPFAVLDGSLYSIKKARNENETDKTIFVSRYVPILTKEFHNVERPQVLYEMTWKQANREISEVIPASTIAIRKELLELSEKGFSVNDNNAKSLISFMDFYLLENDIEKHYAVERLGNIKDKFIHPILTKDIEIMAIDQGEKQLKDGFEVKGTSDTWKSEIFDRIKDQPKAVFMTLSSFASAIIKELGIKPFIVELSGTSSQGKTTTLEIASTVWGTNDLVNEWNATRVSIERKSAFLNSFPLLMDDTKKADERVLKQVIYNFSGGRSKGRGSLKGSQREYTWNNIMLSTGEVSLNDYAKNDGGAAARIIPLGDEPLKKDHDNVIHLNEAMKQNFGAIGIDFLKVWAEHKEKLLPDFHKVRSLYVKKAKGNNVLSRLSEYYAAVHFTGQVLIDYLDMDIKLTDLVKLFDGIVQENKSIDKPIQFLEEILTELDSSRLDIFYDIEPVVNKAIYKKVQLYLTPSFVARFLGVEEKQIRREWLKRGLTVGKQEKGTYVDYKAVSHRGKTYRVIPVNMDYVEELGFNFEDDRG